MLNQYHLPKYVCVMSALCAFVASMIITHTHNHDENALASLIFMFLVILGVSTITMFIKNRSDIINIMLRGLFIVNCLSIAGMAIALIK